MNKIIFGGNSNMKKFRIITAITAIFLTFSFFIKPACATQLPQPIVDYIKTKFPDVSIRFDGLVELPDHTIYLPVSPLVYGNAATPAAVIQTIPSKTDFTQKPDMILFVNNLALLKVVKYGEDKLTVNYSPEIPLSVKLGLLPQDLIVPHGLILPTELRIILGDLKIPIKPKKDEDGFVFYNDPSLKNEKKVNFIAGKTKDGNPKASSGLAFMNKKVFYASNFKESKLNILNSETGRLVSSMKLPAVPSNMILTPEGRYLLISSMSSNRLFVVDTFDNVLLKEIAVGKLPSSILTEKGSQKAYVANKHSSSVSEIDLENMVLTREIPVAGTPDNLVFDEENKNIFYNDTISGAVYKLNIGTGLCTKVMQGKNISKITLFNDYLLVLNRSEAEMVVYDLENNKEYARVKVGEKPLDIQVFGKKQEIYVLSAGSDELNIVDTKEFKLKKSIVLNSSGFPTKITLMEKANKLLISNQDAYQIVVFDITGEKILGTIPTSMSISFLQVSK